MYSCTYYQLPHIWVVNDYTYPRYGWSMIYLPQIRVVVWPLGPITMIGLDMGGLGRGGLDMGGTAVGITHRAQISRTHKNGFL